MPLIWSVLPVMMYRTRLMLIYNRDTDPCEMILFPKFVITSGAYESNNFSVDTLTGVNLMAWLKLYSTA